MQHVCHWPARLFFAGAVIFLLVGVLEASQVVNADPQDDAVAVAPEDDAVADAPEDEAKLSPEQTEDIELKMLKAIQYDDEQVMMHALEADEDPNGMYENTKVNDTMIYQNVWLHWCAIYNAKHCAIKLESAKANIRATDTRGWTALHYAAYYGKLLMAKYLHRADHSLKKVKTGNDETAYELICQSDEECSAHVLNDLRTTLELKNSNPPSEL